MAQQAIEAVESPDQLQSILLEAAVDQWSDLFGQPVDSFQYPRLPLPFEPIDVGIPEAIPLLDGIVEEVPPNRTAATAAGDILSGLNIPLPDIDLPSIGNLTFAPPFDRSSPMATFFIRCKTDCCRSSTSPTLRICCWRHRQSCRRLASFSSPGIFWRRSANTAAPFRSSGRRHRTFKRSKSRCSI